MYATISHVEAFCVVRAPFGDDTQPSASQVAMYIEDATIEVEDALLKAGYDTPVPPTASYAFRFLQGAVAKAAAYLVEENAPTSNRRDATKQMRDSALKMIADGELIGLEKNIAQAGPRWNLPTATPAFTSEQLF